MFAIVTVNIVVTYIDRENKEFYILCSGLTLLFATALDILKWKLISSYLLSISLRKFSGLGSGGSKYVQ